MKISKTFLKKAKDFSSSKSKCLFFMPAFVRAFLFKSSPNGELSYKVRKTPRFLPWSLSKHSFFYFPQKQRIASLTKTTVPSPTLRSIFSLNSLPGSVFCHFSILPLCNFRFKELYERSIQTRYDKCSDSGYRPDSVSCGYRKYDTDHKYHDI